MAGPYREQLYVEPAAPIDRCFCEAAAVGRCRCCRRSRCAEHLARRLCSRCTQAVGRAMRARDWRAWDVGGVFGVGTWLVLLQLLPLAAVFIALSAAVITGLGYKQLDRARLIRTLRPMLWSTSGELPPEPREPLDLRDPRLGGPYNY
jgi:hypothetical protein